MANKSDRINLHHCEPICLSGRDIKENLIELKQSTHKQLHDTMDIPRNIYSRMQRRAKKRTNHKILMNPGDIDIWKDMGRLYFENIHKLPKWLQQKHVQCMMRQVEYDRRNYSKLTGDEYDKPSNYKRTHQETFDMLYEHSIQAQKDIAKELLRNLALNHTV